MARATRLYEQRRNAYQDLAVFYERARLWIEPTEVSWPEPPSRATADEWIDVMARAAVAGSAEVQAKLPAFHDLEFEVYVASELLDAAMKGLKGEEEISEAREYLEKTRSEALKLIDEAEQAMRDELAAL